MSNRGKDWLRQAKRDLEHAKNARKDKYYIPTRYPNGFDEGIPADYYTEEESTRGINYAGEIIRFSEDEIEKMQNQPSIFKTAVETGLEVNFKEHNCVN